MHKSVDAPPRRLRLGQWLIGFFILLSGAGLVWYYDIGQADPAQQGGRGGRGGGPERPPVRVVQAETRSIAVALKALGTVTPVNTVVVRSRLDGELVRVHFREGQRVKAGQILAEIDPRPYQVALAQAEAQRSENQARLANCSRRPAELPFPLRAAAHPRQQVTTQEALVKQIGARSSRTRRRSTTRSCSCRTRRSSRPSPDGSASGRSMPATSYAAATPTASSSSPRCGRSRCSSPCPRPSCRRCSTRCAPTTRRPSRRGTAPRRPSLATGALQTVDNQIDTTTGTIKLRAMFDNARREAVPEPVRQHPAALSDAARRDGRPGGRRCSARRSARSSTSSKPTARRRSARVTLGPSEGRARCRSPKASRRASASCSRASTS